ncbi:TPA: hypothetical protein JAV82_001257 [Kluyvera ascorbata]|uniref:hypothetical protein n=1 Tax=Kluyvera ascorbata TaxID=51288 RepID=UPI001A30003B|nr:hypothetical protein [Kluyvera ascorbata]HAT7513514.1 hypothetical protein [Kluyvera ascorbata]
MNRAFILSLILVSPAVLAKDSFVQTVKNVFQEYTKVDASDWYSKGDTAFAEFTGDNLGIYQHLKTSVRDNSINIKMEYAPGKEKPDSEKFMVATTAVCQVVFKNVILTPEELDKLQSWDDDVRDPFDFMSSETAKDAGNGYNEEKINGWDVKIKRDAMLTTCTAEKI